MMSKVQNPKSKVRERTRKDKYKTGDEHEASENKAGGAEDTETQECRIKSKNTDLNTRVMKETQVSDVWENRQRQEVEG